MPEHDTIDHGPLIHAATEKTTPVDADEVGLVDSAASNVLKRLTWSNIKATLKTYFDTLYSAVTHRHLVGWSSYALGNGALSSLTSGSYNVAIGDFAANKVTTGSSVIAIGNSAAGNVKGVKNVAIGAFALMSEGAGANNVAIGGDALLYVENAYGSVAIGKDAGSYIADGTTPRTHGGYDVFIGYRAKSLNNTSYQNEIVIGYDAIGHGANTVTLGNDGITHTHLKGAVSADDQPKFLAVLSANHLDVTGDGTVYNILETWTEIEDVGGCFSSGVYTAKKSGLHLLTGIVSYSNITLDVANILVYIITSNRTYVAFTTGNIRNSSFIARVSVSLLVYMDLGDTAYLAAKVGGTTKVVDVLAGETCFGGYALP